MTQARENAQELNRRIWEEKYSEQKTQQTRAYEPFMEIIAKLIQKRGVATALDFACGTGSLGCHLIQTEKLSTLRLDGVDITQGALEMAKPWYQHLERTNGTTPPAGKRYDLVCLNSLIEHVEPEVLDVLLTNIHACLNPGGALFVVVPNFYSPRRFLAGLRKEWEIERTVLGHVNLHTYGSVQKLLKKHGFLHPRFSFFTIFRHLHLTTYARQPGLPRWMKSAFWTLVHLFPFYFLRDSFCLVCTKPKAR